MSTGPVVATTQRYLRRLFPKRGVTVTQRDYGNVIDTSFVIDDDFGASRVVGIRTITGFVASDEGRKILAGELLRTAYPRGWAVP